MYHLRWIATIAYFPSNPSLHQTACRRPATSATSLPATRLSTARMICLTAWGGYMVRNGQVPQHLKSHCEKWCHQGITCVLSSPKLQWFKWYKLLSCHLEENMMSVCYFYMVLDLKFPLQLLCIFKLCSGFRLVNTKCMMLVDMWKKIQHSNSVTLREVFTTKAFGDHCKSLYCTQKVFRKTHSFHCLRIFVIQSFKLCFSPHPLKLSQL